MQCKQLLVAANEAYKLGYNEKAYKMYTEYFTKQQLESENIKKQGNEAFKNNQLKEALKFYTKSLLLNPMDYSIYSNRCAAYLALNKPEFALIDAINCVKLNTNWAKGYFRLGRAFYGLYNFDRAVYCLQLGLKLDPQNQELLTWLEKAKENLNKTQHKEEFKNIRSGEVVQVPQQSMRFIFRPIKKTAITTDQDYYDKLTEKCPFVVRMTEKAGRGLYAKRDIKKGDVFYSEIPFVSASLREDRCYYCFRPLVNQVKCPKCKVEIYCSEGCRIEAFKRYHEPLCSRIDMNYFKNKYPQKEALGIYLSVKVLGRIIQSNEWLNGQLENALDYSKLKYISDGPGSIEMTYEPYWTAFESLVSQLNLEGLPMFDLQWYIHMRMVFTTNAMFMKSGLETPNGDKYLERGLALFEIACYFNHDCGCNVNWYNLPDPTGHLMYFEANRDIKVGEQLLISYVDDHLKGQARQIYLLQYGIFCECEKCYDPQHKLNYTIFRPDDE